MGTCLISSTFHFLLKMQTTLYVPTKSEVIVDREGKFRYLIDKMTSGSLSLYAEKDEMKKILLGLCGLCFCFLLYHSTLGVYRLA